ncbi:MAG: hypothetical protein Q8Q09_01140 [Deltaproteobacteria bacterium]|nr:hypothetical protein [Deltaproteobacteria bacterium]
MWSLSQRTRRSLVSVALATVLGPMSCRSPLTHLVVELATDIPMEGLSQINVHCSHNWDGTPGGGDSTCELLVMRGAGTASNAVVCLPATFGINIFAPSEGRELTIVAASLDGRLQRVVRVTPPTQQVRLLRLRLAAVCALQSTVSMAHPCPNRLMSCTKSESCQSLGQTCGDEGTCVSNSISSGDLLEIPRTGIPDAGLTPLVNGMCPTQRFANTPSDVMGRDASIDDARRD